MRRVHYAWLMAAAGFVTLITSAGFRSTSGVLIVPLQDEFGWIFCAHQLGAAVAAWGAGAARTWFGDYGWAFGSAGLLCLFASGLVTRIDRTPSPALPAPSLA